MSRRNRVLLVLLVVAGLAAGGVAAYRGVTGDDQREDSGSSVSATVSADGVHLSFDGVEVDGPAGVAGEGAVLTATRAPVAPSGNGSRFADLVGAGITLRLDSGQPQKPLILTFPLVAAPADGTSVAVLTQPSGTAETHLMAATLTPARNAVVVEVDHLSSFWSAVVDLADLASSVVTQITGITTPRPDCAGKPAAGPGGTNVQLAGDNVTNLVVWSCVTVEQSAAKVTVFNNTPLPYRVRAAPSATLLEPGETDLAKAAITAAYHVLATSRPYAEGLLVPGSSLTYELPVEQLPGQVAGELDVGAYLGMALLFGVKLLMSVYGVDKLPEFKRFTELEKNAEAIDCLAKALKVANMGASPPLDQVAAFAGTVLTCLRPVLESGLGLILKAAVGVVLGIITSGVALFYGGLQGAFLTAFGKDRFRVDVKATWPVLGFDHYGPLKIGMGLQEVLNTRIVQLEASSGGSGCTFLSEKGKAPTDWEGRLNALVTRAGHLVGINPPRQVVTEAGVGVDSTADQVRQAYRGHDISQFENQAGPILLVRGPSDLYLGFQLSSGGVVIDVLAGEREYASGFELCSGG